MTVAPKKLAILVSGGPAPGINSVISAATIRAALEGVEVLGIRDGFKWVMRGDVDHAVPLTIDDVSRIHYGGGSFIGTTRDNPTRREGDLDRAVASLLRLGADKLITIGGDDTAYSALRLEEAAGGELRVVHVPKTIDNDLDLPHGIPTFGFQTARHLGVHLVKNLMVDARTTSRWYLVVTMGRKAGHLALGIGKAAGATLTVVPEEFPDGPVRLRQIVDILVGAVVKRLAHGRSDGVAVLAEGLAERLDPDEVAELSDAERDAYDHVRLAEVGLGELLKHRMQDELQGLGISTTVVAKNVGYELRCADPIPFDLEYTRDLGYCAAQHLLDGGSRAMISVQNGRFVPMPFDEILDPATGRTRVRMVDVGSESYRVARRYMLRLTREDLEDPERLARYAATAGLGADAFRDRFGYLVESDPGEA